MNLRALTRKYFGWCPGTEAASRFGLNHIIRAPSLPHFGVISTFLILLFGVLVFLPHLILPIRVLLLDYPGPELGTAMWSVISFLIMISSLVLTYRWFKPLGYKRLRINMRNLVFLGIITYAFALIWMNSYDLVNWVPRGIFPLWILTFWNSRTIGFFHRVLAITMGFVLLNLTSKIIRVPVLNEENTKLAILAIGGLSLTGVLGLISVIPNIIHYARAHPEEIGLEVVPHLLFPIMAYISLGVLVYDVFIQRRIRYRVGSIVLYTWLAASLFDYLLEIYFWVFKYGLDSNWLLSILTGSPFLFRILSLPNPGPLFIALVIIGIILHHSGLGTPMRLKTVYSVAIISSAIFNMYSATRLPRTLNFFFRGMENLISKEDIYLLGSIPSPAVWSNLIDVFMGVLIFAFGILCLVQPRIDFDIEALYRLGPRQLFDWSRITRRVLAVLGTIAVLSSLFFITPYFNPKVIKWKEQYQSLDYRKRYTPLTPMDDPPADWIQVAQHSDPAGDHVAPNIMKNGVAAGGTNYIGTDILNVTLHSPFLSDELMIVVCLNGTGRDDPTIDQNRTKLKVSFDGIRTEGWASIYYTGESYGRSSDRWSRLSLGDFSYDWTDPCRLNLYFKKLPLTDIINDIRITTETEYVEEESGSSVYILQVIDQLRIGSFGLSRGLALTSLDFSKHNAPLYGSSMTGMDIVEVDVYRGGRYLNVTVRLSDEGWFDDTIPDTMRRRCVIWFRRESGRYINPEEVAEGWTKKGTIWCRIVDIGGIQETNDPISSIIVKSRVLFDIIIDTAEKIREEQGVSWDADVCIIMIDTDGIS